MTLSNRRRGFTLVELLVVISIIALLIGILIPAIGQARTTARLTIDQSSLRQHGIGAFNYAGDHQDNMPNLPPGSGGGGVVGAVTSGVSNRPMNNWGVDNDQIDASVNGLAMGGDPILHGNIWKMYNWAFGEYIVDGATGQQLMNSVFLSSFHSGRRDTWDELARTNDPEIPSFPKDYTVGSSGLDFLDYPLLKAPGSEVPEFDEQRNAYFLQPTWRYSLVATVGTHERTGKYFWGASTSQTTAGPDNTSAYLQNNQWVNFRQYVKKSQYRVPTQKVMFWNPFDFVTSAPHYAFPTALVPAVMVDSSTRVIKMGEECLFTAAPGFTEMTQDDQKKISDAFLAGDYVSTHFIYNKGAGPATADLPLNGYPALFQTGIWGVETRDLGGKGLDDEDD